MTNEEYNCMRYDVDRISINTIKEMEESVKGYLDKCGVFYKNFSRIKKGNSVCEKIRKREGAGRKEYRLQDLVGMRIVVYFKADIRLCEKIISQHFQVLDISKDDDGTEVFRPQRINYVCKMPEEVIQNFDNKIWEYPIDKTFEVQIRTIFSEGWHEVEHDFRYKCIEEWEKIPDLSRTMNGIFATLDNCDWTIANLFHQVAYIHYKNGEWIAMLKNVFLIRIVDTEEMESILTYFDQNRNIAKKFFRLDREEFLIKLSDVNIKLPLKMKNVVYLANLLQVHDKIIEDMTPDIIKEIVCKSGNQGQGIRKHTNSLKPI